LFIDELTIRVCSGSGGKGCESYRKRPDHKRIPNGGDGGNGGNVILIADLHTGNLAALKSKRIFEAENGGAGMGNHRHGRNGKDCVVSLPCGTTVYSRRDGLLIRDLTTPGEEVVVVCGGKGGHGNHKGRRSTPGEASKELELSVSFKIMADIFLVGLPNSGKTLLLKKLTGAHIQETDYPFATKSPQLGTYETDEHVFRICELPSIGESSASGGGLGTHYLKHLERARLMFFLVDLEPRFASDLQDGFDVLIRTVDQFNSELRNLPYFLVVNKVDLVDKNRLERKRFSKDGRTFWISARKGTGVEALMKAAREVLVPHHFKVRP